MRPLTEEDISKLHNFSINEKTIFGTYAFEKYWEIDADFMFLTDQTVTIAKQIFGKKNGAFIIHDFNLLKHKPDSFHYPNPDEDRLCVAVDGHFINILPIEAYILFSKAGFRAFGWYPEWNRPGYHIDMRPQRHVSTWVAYYVTEGSKKKQKYDYNLYSFIKALKSDRSAVYNTV